MKHFLPALRIFLFLSLVTGVFYPALVTGISQTFFPEEAQGRPSLIQQKFESPRSFWGRPSASEFPSGGSNLGPTSAALKKIYEERKSQLKAAHGSEIDPPQDLLFASGSGLDPEISPEAAAYQIERVAKNRAMSIEQVQKLVQTQTVGRQFGVLGEPRVNVLELNKALDRFP